jgi:hypothetical protein
VVTHVSPDGAQIGPEIIKITDMNTETVGFDVIIDMDASVVSIQYDSPSGDVCYPTTDISAPIPVSAVCYDGVASVTVFIYSSDVAQDECESCKIPSDDSVEYAAVQLEIPCEPICDPIGDAVDCFNGPLVKTSKATCESLEFVSIEDQTGSSVTYSIKNTLASSNGFEVSYVKQTGPSCQTVPPLAPGETFATALEAFCDPATGIALVEVLVGAGDGSCTDSATIGCSVTYEVPCSTDMMCTSVRHLHEAEGFLTKEMKAAAAESSEGEDAPYCVHKDFPCEGDEANMVYVCHYSTRAGYQTFCIPEGDSDIMRFYANDYCGPCEGWNGVTHAGQAI